MNNLLKIMLGGLACLGFGSAYAFTPSQSTCEQYINSMAPLNGDYFMNNQPKIEACLNACPTMYGTGSDSATLNNISRCAKNLRTLSLVGKNALLNPQYGNSNNNNNQMALTVPNNNAITQAPVEASQQTSPVTPVAAPAAAPQNAQQNNTAKTNQQIKWF